MTVGTSKIGKVPIHIVCLPPPGRAVVSQVQAAFEQDLSTIPSRPSAISSVTTNGIDPHGNATSSALFHDALAVRKTVFIDEQRCAWSEEVDGDDARSWHFVAYSHRPGDDADPSSSGPSCSSDASTAAETTFSPVPGPMASPPTPIATLRLVPGPHASHPLPGSVDGVGGAREREPLPGHRDIATRFHDGRELYAKIGRVATVASARGRGVARKLMAEAIAWAEGHGADLDLKRASEDAENVAGVRDDSCGERVGEGDAAASAGSGFGGMRHGIVDDNDHHGYDDVGREWKGLLMVHSQKDVVPVYEKYGFVIDEELGEWIEVDIPHVAMWRRLEQH